jgi:hypothetical protein
VGAAKAVDMEIGAIEASAGGLSEDLIKWRHVREVIRRCVDLLKSSAYP